ncbi:hypothetical protein RB195_020821 [Necator americanus]|uniref:Uncharacterized protein n=1 Tax=Necator americanus TaxID=51031 RepID=A0ABR1CKU0_NECAM
MDNEWSTDFTLPLLNLLRTTGNETAAYLKAKLICESNAALELCLNRCNKSQESAILLAGIKSWQDACAHLEEVRAQFPCWRENGHELSQSCRVQTINLKESMHLFARNQSQQNIQNICRSMVIHTNDFVSGTIKYENPGRVEFAEELCEHSKVIN